MRRVVLFAAVLGFCSLAVPVFAEVITVEATIKTVDAQAGTVTIIAKARSGEKTLELDLSRRATVTVDGKQADLKALLIGQKATVAYDPDLEVITKLDASGLGKPVAEKPKPQLVKVSELVVDGGVANHPWLSEDGLTMYFAAGGQGAPAMIYVAQRDDAESLFQKPTPLFQGTMPTLTADGLRLICLIPRADGKQGPSLHEAVRDSVDNPFKRPQEIPSIRTSRTPFTPALSADGLTLCVTLDSGAGPEPVMFSRKTLTSDWGNHKSLIGVRFNGRVTWPFLSADGLVMLCHHEDRADNNEQKGDLKARLAGTTWRNTNNVSFEWTTDGRFLHNGKEREWKVLDDKRVQIVFGTQHKDTLEFDKSFKTFKQSVRGGGESMTGNRTGGGEVANLMIWRRSDATKPFDKYEYIEVKGLPPLAGRSPRYVAATKELFFVRALPPNKYELLCLKNFELPELAAR